jgi:outer membrane protein OmpA-like peptidoglycan-associated protein
VIRRFLIAAPLLLLLTSGHSADAADPARRYAVFFSSWSAKIDKQGEGVIAKAVAWAKAHPDHPLLVHGFASTIGSAPANKLLSALRAQMVSDALETAGLPHERITRDAEGATAFAMDPQESRRVEIIFTGP